MKTGPENSIPARVAGRLGTGTHGPASSRGHAGREAGDVGNRPSDSDTPLTRAGDALPSKRNREPPPVYRRLKVAITVPRSVRREGAGEGGLAASARPEQGDGVVPFEKQADNP